MRSEREYSGRYCFHGIGIEVRAYDPAVLAALHRRLRPFQHGGPVEAMLTFVYQEERGWPGLVRMRPAGAARPIYTPARGEALYLEKTDQLYLDTGDGARVLCDPRSGSTEVRVVSAHPASTWVLSHPVFTLTLVELLKRHGRYSLHAAGLCTEGRGLLLPGTSGAGKSTLTIALLKAGFGFLGDDMLFLRQTAAGAAAAGVRRGRTAAFPAGTAVGRGPAAGAGAGLSAAAAAGPAPGARVARRSPPGTGARCPAPGPPLATAGCGGVRPPARHRPSRPSSAGRAMPAPSTRSRGAARRACRAAGAGSHGVAVGAGAILLAGTGARR